jgi:hypothetical protein
MVLPSLSAVVIEGLEKRLSSSLKRREKQNNLRHFSSLYYS